MSIKIFQASGFDGINRLESEIEKWMTQNLVTVEHLSTSMCQVAENPAGERGQHLVVTIIYRGLDSN